MPSIVWGAVGERVYETGVDRGVLYVGDQSGVPWNGLVTVEESSEGGDITSYYLDGIQYLNVQGVEEFVGKIEAYTYPDEFSECDGTQEISNGLFATTQKRKSFGLTYRTRIGNDVSGPDFGYKLHLIYDAKAKPSAKSYTSLGDSIDPLNFSWDIVTKPTVLQGRRPSSHFIIDSRTAPSFLLGYLENILYGDGIENPRLPSVSELIDLFYLFGATIIDAGGPLDAQTAFYDGGYANSNQTGNLDSGGAVANDPVADAGGPSDISSITYDRGLYNDETYTSTLDGGSL